MLRAVFFDVDFTLIYPGPTFRGEGYQAFCARHGIAVDPTRFERAVVRAAVVLDSIQDELYNDDLFIRYTRRIIEGMGGSGDALDTCAREIYAEWAADRHFELYEDVSPALVRLKAMGLRIGLISNSHRRLSSFQSHFELDGLIAAAISSSEHGFMKPHESIFRAAMDAVEAAPHESLMVGDSIRHDIDGALAVGMAAVFLHRESGTHPAESRLAERGVPTIKSLAELPALVTSRLKPRA